MSDSQWPSPTCVASLLLLLFGAGVRTLTSRHFLPISRHHEVMYQAPPSLVPRPPLQLLSLAERIAAVEAWERG